tara:strand:+ start:1227 stop:1889 length:663 start_codon:yes stop_codon:yes gene_type:complete
MASTTIEFKNLEIVPFLATPIYIVNTSFRLTDNEMSVIENDGFKSIKDNPERLVVAGVEVSQNNTLLEEPGLHRLRHFMNDVTMKFIHNDLKLKNEFYMTSSWATKNEKGSKHHGHTHPNTLFSTVYYARAESGQLVIAATQNGLTPNFDFQYDIESYNVFNAKSWNIPVKTGDIVIFPGWLQHYTTPNEHEQPRIVVGANFFTRGKFGKYENTDYLEIK